MYEEEIGEERSLPIRKRRKQNNSSCSNEVYGIAKTRVPENFAREKVVS